MPYLLSFCGPSFLIYLVWFWFFLFFKNLAMLWYNLPDACCLEIIYCFLLERERDFVWACLCFSLSGCVDMYVFISWVNRSELATCCILKEDVVISWLVLCLQGLFVGCIFVTVLLLFFVFFFNSRKQHFLEL